MFDPRLEALEGLTKLYPGERVLNHLGHIRAHLGRAEPAELTGEAV